MHIQFSWIFLLWGSNLIKKITFIKAARIPGRVRITTDKADYYHRKRLIIEFIGSLGLFANALGIGGAQIPLAADGDILGPLNAEIVISEAPRRKTAEEIVREYLKDTPDLIAVAWCESRFRQFDANGSIHRGQVNSDDIGVMQINMVYHLQKAMDLKMDIFTLEGNMAYGRYLYEQEGLQPWSASRPCWIRYINNQNNLAFAEVN